MVLWKTNRHSRHRTLTRTFHCTLHMIGVISPRSKRKNTSTTFLFAIFIKINFSKTVPKHFYLNFLWIYRNAYSKYFSTFQGISTKYWMKTFLTYFLNHFSIFLDAKYEPYNKTNRNIFWNASEIFPRMFLKWLLEHFWNGFMKSL